jgi:hypothetical protein
MFLSSVNRSSWYPWPTLARSEPTRMASAGGQLRALNRLRAAEALGDLASGFDASLSGEIDGPVRQYQTAGPRGPLDRVAHIANRKHCRPHARNWY